ncbi:MAG: GNAT family N-acetyltransferase [Chloracidobacterium sp.]|nr:GNAT family N-acetyltransferase [Chloracidobacterium sp.]
METDRLKLLPCRMEDIQDIHQLWTNDQIRSFLFDNRIISLDEAQAFVEGSIANFSQHGYGIWLVYHRRSNRLIGFAGLLCSAEREPYLIYGIHPDHVGHGYATEAAEVVLDYGLRKLGLSKVRADVDEPNNASVRVLEKLGMNQVECKITEGQSLLYFEING